MPIIEPPVDAQSHKVGRRTILKGSPPACKNDLSGRAPGAPTCFRFSERHEHFYDPLPVAPLHVVSVCHLNSNPQKVPELSRDPGQLGYQRKIRLAWVVNESAARAPVGRLAVAPANAEDTVAVGEVQDRLRIFLPVSLIRPALAMPEL